MSYDLDLVRAILRQFGRPQARGFLDTDGATLSPPTVVGADERALPIHVERLIEVGLVRQTNEIHMRYPPDPVTLRVTEPGRTWVRRAFNDEEWSECSGELTILLDQM
jgi:hypothetical protein